MRKALVYLASVCSLIVFPGCGGCQQSTKETAKEMTKTTVETSKELKRRSVVKSLLWRLIGIAWTWVGAYIILILIPPSRETAATIATLIVVYHHSTRMVMYYFYERFWGSIAWGRTDSPGRMSFREKTLWTLGSIATLVIIFYLIIYVSPKIKPKKSTSCTIDHRNMLPIHPPHITSQHHAKKRFMGVRHLPAESVGGKSAL